MKYNPDRLLNTAEAAKFLRVSQASIRRWSDAGLLTSRRVGRRRERRFSESDLNAFLQDQVRPRAAAEAVNVGGLFIGVPGHLATLYGTDQARFRLTLPFFAEGIRSGHTCILVASGAVREHYLRELGADKDINLDLAMATEQFRVVRFEGGKVHDALSFWEASFAAALAKGPTVIRVVGEMVEEREMFSSEDEMLVYEEAFEVMYRRYPTVIICQYDVRHFNGVALLRALKAHPDLYGLRLGTFLN